jgi:tyrosyl-tRNA synthetase
LDPYDFWQFWRNVADADVGRFLRIYTELSLEEIEALEKCAGAELNSVKKRLADIATSMAHGEEVLPSIHARIAELFEASKGNLSSLPSIEITESDLPLPIDEAFVRFNLASSKGEARRLIQGGGVRVDDVVISDIKATLTKESFQTDGRLKLSSGKKKHFILALNQQQKV